MSPSPTVVGLFILAALVRLALIVFGEWQDKNLAVKYTDIDYEVFTDAARYVAHGQSPYQRATYRYTPMLAYMMLPNVLMHKAFGKVFFAMCDIAIGVLLYWILAVASDDRLAQRKKGDCATFAKRSEGPFSTVPFREESLPFRVFEWMQRQLLLLPGAKPADVRLYCVLYWLFNPISINVSTRGNAESIVGVLVLLVLYFLLSGHHDISAVWFGLAVHFKIYPIVYALPLVLWLDESKVPLKGPRRTYIASAVRGVFSLFSPRRVRFGAISGSVFLLLTGAMYYAYGYPFLHEAYLYHVTRSDHRHNLSVYFYYLYLQTAATVFSWTALLAFLPQVILLIATSVRFASRDLALCLFIQTVLFVAFNKVCTVQYFIWYVVLLPLVIPSTSLSWKGAVWLTGFWLGSQMLWLSLAYYLEFEGRNTYLGIWGAGLLFFASHIVILSAVCRYSRA